MPVIVVTSQDQGAGKTGVAASLARHIAYAGRPVRLLRTVGDGNSGLDGAYFASLEFVPGTKAEPIAPADVANPRVGTYVVEAALADAEQLPAARLVLVSRGLPPESLPVGIDVTRVVVTAVDGSGEDLPDNIDSVPVVGVPDDQRLAGFSVAEAREALDAQVLVPGEGEDTTCDQLVLAPISSDAGQPYLKRFNNSAVVCRFDRADMHLAAIRSNPSCLILTGGRRPSDYLFDAARSQGIPVLLSGSDTEKTVAALENVFEQTRFQGETKLNRLSELLEPTGLFEALDFDAGAGQA